MNWNIKTLIFHWLFSVNYISKLLIQNITLKCNFPSNIILIKYTNLHENITRQVFLIKSWLANLRHALNDLMEQTKCTFCNLLQGFKIWKLVFSRDKKSFKINVSIQLKYNYTNKLKLYNYIQFHIHLNLNSPLQLFWLIPVPVWCQCV